MKLSEAIRLGAMLKPQGAGQFYDTSGGSCALGAALDARGHLNEAEPGDGAQMDFLRKQWPIMQLPVPCPQCLSPCDDLFWTITTHLNDAHHWTRERIADQVEIWEKEIEAQQDQAQPAELVESVG